MSDDNNKTDKASETVKFGAWDADIEWTPEMQAYAEYKQKEKERKLFYRIKKHFSDHLPIWVGNGFVAAMIALFTYLQGK